MAFDNVSDCCILRTVYPWILAKVLYFTACESNSCWTYSEFTLLVLRFFSPLLTSWNCFEGIDGSFRTTGVSTCVSDRQKKYQWNYDVVELIWTDLLDSEVYCCMWNYCGIAMFKLMARLKFLKFNLILKNKKFRTKYLCEFNDV